MSYFLLVPLLLILYVLLKKKHISKKETKKVIQPNGFNTPFSRAFNSTVSYEDKIKGINGIYDSTNDIKNSPIIKHQYPSYFYRVAVFVNRTSQIGSSLYSYLSDDYKRDFVKGDLTTMRNDALAFYYERINANNQNGMNPVRDYYNHFPLSKYKTQDSNTIAIALYLVKNLGNENFTEYLIGGDEKEYLEKGRVIESALLAVNTYN